MKKSKAKSRTRKAVDAIMRSRLETANGEHREPLTIYKAAKRYGIHASAVSRALRKRLKEKRCESCGQVIR